LGKKVQRGIKLAAKSTKSVTIEYADTKGLKAEGAVSAVRKLVNTDNIDVLIGPFGPDASIATAPVTSKKDILTFAISLCSPKYQEHKNLFCIYPSIREQLRKIPKFLSNKSINTLALITEQSRYGRTTKQVIQTNTSDEHKVIYNETINPETTSLRTVATKVISKDPDAVFVGSSDVEQSFSLMKQLNELGYEGTRIAYVDTDPKYIEKFGKSVEGVYVPGALGSNFSNGYTTKFKNVYNTKPDLYSAIGFDTLNFLRKALQKNNRLTGIKETLINTDYQNPAIDGFNFRSDRTIYFPTEIWQIKNGEYKPI
jgi:ABC-type branched-subunit amino acid transport system substrate-binding protein